jgi:uncharacterized protein (TIGR03437 family)
MGFKCCLIFSLAVIAASAAEDRVQEKVEPAQLVQLKGQVNPRARAEFDQGPADPALRIQYATLYLQPAGGLESFLADQQNPSSPNFHKWLTPEQFGDRFGLSGNDIGQVTAWLRSSGFTIHDVARGRLWVTFSGTAAQASSAFHTEIHRYLVNGESHFANSTDISIPAAFGPVVLGVGGLTDFHPQPVHGKLKPRLATNPGILLTPDDLATIYDLTPLYGTGIDGTGQTIAILGESDIDPFDIFIYQLSFNLATNVPQVVLYGSDPGYVPGAQDEADLDLEISGAIARNATILYVNSNDINLSALYAVDQNLAKVMSMSYGGCEFTNPETQTLRPVAQQANAQGITWMAASGDVGAATCDRDSPTPQATKGDTVSSPASFPEVTAVGGTEFNEGTGNYWAFSNGSNGGSVPSYMAISYIPEQAWNDSALANALIGGGGGASAYFAKPVWQTGPGVPDDGARDLPDVSFAASWLHDGYYIVSQGNFFSSGGTSASSPLFAGIVALLNQSQAQANPGAPAGLGNINPDLYRLAQATTDVFHDITVGNNMVPCAQGSPDCVNGMLGFAAGPGYDQATGLGSVDAARLIAEWNSGTASTTTLSVNPATIGTTDTVQLTATVTGAGPVPSGTVTFVAGDVTLGSAALKPAGKAATAVISASGSLIVGGNLIVGALYSGDSNYVASSGTTTVAVKLPASGSLVIPTVTPNPVPQLGFGWPYALRLSEMAGVATQLTAFTIDGENNLNNFQTTNIAANGSLSVELQGSGLTVPVNRNFHFEGMDASGATWQQNLVVPFTGPAIPVKIPGISLTVSPSIMQRNPSADPSCRWSQQVTVQETGGYQTTLLVFIGLSTGSNIVDYNLSQFFGTARLAPWGVLTGTACYANVEVPALGSYQLSGVSEIGAPVSATATVSLAQASAAPTTMTVSAPSVSISAPAGTNSGAAQLGLQFGAGSPAWTAVVIPAVQNWLSVSSLAGAGNTTLQLTVSAAGLSNGVYNATISIQAQDVLPQSIQVPVTFVVGASSNLSIGGIANAGSFTHSYAPGQLIAVFGSNLVAAEQIAGIQPLPLTMNGTSATVNGVAAPLWFVSPGQINLQIPYETSAGPAVLGINNGGQIASFQLNVTPTAPGIFASNGSLVPYATGQQGEEIVAYITGDGDVTPTLATGASPSSSLTLSQLPASRQPLTLTVGGQPATIVFDGIVSGLIGVTQVNFNIPSNVPTGVQPVVVTAGGVSSAPVNVTVTAASPM